MCTMGEHKLHDTVQAQIVRSEKVINMNDLSLFKEVLMKWKKVMNQRIQQEEKLCQDLKKAIGNVKCSAQSACDEIDRMFTELLACIERWRSEVKDQLRAQEENELRGAEGVLEQAEMEIVNLKRKNAKLEETLQTGDHIEFLQNFLSLTCPSWTDASATPPPNTNVTFERVVHSVSKLQKTLEDIYSTEMSNISEKIEEVSVFRWRSPRQTKQALKPLLNFNQEPMTREDFLHYSCFLTLEPDAEHPNLSVCLGNRTVQWVACASSVGKWPQVLCREGLTGRCYWEAEWSGSGFCTIGLCEGSQRKGWLLANGFGQDTLSWGLDCFHLSYLFRHGNENTTIPAPKSTSRVGVYLDHKAGTLSFYSVSSTMTLLHRAHFNFTQPLYPGFALWPNGWQRTISSNFFNAAPLTSEKGQVSLKLVNL